MTAAPPTPVEYQLIGLAEDGGIGDLLVGLDQKQGRVRLQALISEWLRMENLVVLTGSGTSVSAGGKTMANLETAVFATLEALSDVRHQIAGVLRCRRKADVREVLRRRFQSLIERVRVRIPLVGGVDRRGDDHAGIQIDRVLGLVGQSRRTILHAGDLRVGIDRALPIRV